MQIHIRSEVIRARVSERQKRELQEAAEREGVSLSEWLRLTVRDALRRERLERPARA